MEEQRKKLEQVITEWKGDQFQVDDILVFGIQFI